MLGIWFILLNGALSRSEWNQPSIAASAVAIPFAWMSNLRSGIEMQRCPAAPGKPAM